MNIIKKIVALISVAIILLRIFVINSFAAFAPVAAEGLIEYLIALLTGAGYSQSELQGMNYNELNGLLGECVNDGRINRDSVIVDSLTGAEISILDFLTDPIVQAGQKTATAITKIAWDNWIKDALAQGLLNPPMLGQNVNDYVIPSTKDQICPYPMYGYGAMVEKTNKYGNKNLIYSNYIVISGDLSFTSYVVKLERVYSSSYGWNEYGGSGINLVQGFDSTCTYKFYGDVRYEDGTPAIELETEYVIGETEDGTKVTVDMLNPDGTVTIDGVTYAPTDFIDLDKFTDTAIDDLIKEINITINNINVEAPDTTQDIVGDISLDVPEELAEYTVPTGIASVFPFCIPVDFVRGMKLMVAKPKAPYFKTELDLTNFCGYNLGKHKIEISFEKWEPAAVICRWFFLLLFSYTLIFLSFKIVKGV